jgi:hypothetical protein
MSEYIQIGTTALRDPATGDFLPAVPMFIRKEDSAKVAALDTYPIASVLAEKFRQYKSESKKARKEVKKG